MSAKDATPQEIAALRERLAERQAQRRFNDEAAQAINMVHRRQPLVIEERNTPLMPRHAAREIPERHAMGGNAAAVWLLRALGRQWLFLLVLGMTVLGSLAVV